MMGMIRIIVIIIAIVIIVIIVIAVILVSSSTNSRNIRKWFRRSTVVELLVFGLREEVVVLSAILAGCPRMQLHSPNLHLVIDVISEGGAEAANKGINMLQASKQASKPVSAAPVVFFDVRVDNCD